MDMGAKYLHIHELTYNRALQFFKNNRFEEKIYELENGLANSPKKHLKGNLLIKFLTNNTDVTSENK